MPVQWNGEQFGDDDLEPVVLAGAELWLDESNRKAPIETAALIRSGVAKADGLKGALGYNTPYAIKQHEELGYQHDQGREAKFLENAGINHKADILGAMADEFKARFS